MTRLEEVLEKAIQEVARRRASFLGSSRTIPEAVAEYVAAIPEPERCALEVGLLLAEVARRRKASIDLWTPDGRSTWIVEYSYGPLSNPKVREVVRGDTPAAALSALLDRLGAAS